VAAHRQARPWQAVNTPASACSCPALFTCPHQKQPS
jgi:hypothetical protein